MLKSLAGAVLAFVVAASPAQAQSSSSTSLNHNHASVIIAGMAVVFLVEHQRQALAKKGKGKGAAAISTGTRSSWKVGQVDYKIQNRLLKNLDRSTASRLIAGAKKSHPGHPEQWYWEKVLYELERDRR